MNHNEIANELIQGKGYHIIPNDVDPNKLKVMLRYIRKLTNIYPTNVLERRAWDLHKKHKIFMEIANNDDVKKIFDIVLGRRHKIGSFGANRLMPGSFGQEAHCDYPYWGLFLKEDLPKNINSSFCLSCQILVPLQDFNENNGGTALVPYSQLLCRYPDQAEFNSKYIQPILNAGDILIYNSLLWHSAMPNISNNDRTCLLGQYSAHFIQEFKNEVIQ
jgi:ectoine hydroxylase-related dioxygenase (phytanoyl-CoA dioxygenase family)